MPRTRARYFCARHFGADSDAERQPMVCLNREEWTQQMFVTERFIGSEYRDGQKRKTIKKLSEATKHSGILDLINEKI